MKAFRILAAAALLTAAFQGINAQEIQNFQNRQPLVSPELTAETITFRLRANYATEVSVQASWMGYGPEAQKAGRMTKGEGGVWSVTLPRPASELYTYTFTVDGVSVLDPANLFVQRDGTSFMSAVLVDGGYADNYKECSRPGNIEHVWYYSGTNDMVRRMYVYSPFGYDRNDKKTKYPVLYLLHGAGGDEEAWSSMGRAAQILDNLIEQGKAQPMIVVMPNGNPNQQAAQTLGLKTSDVNFRDPAYANAYVRSLCEEIVPFIEKEFRVNAKPESRAIAGLSMGGGHTISASTLYPAMFDYICPLSAAGSANDEQIQALKKAGVKLYFLACGTSDFLYEGSKTLDATLTKNGLDHIFYQSEGGHTWANWRLYLQTFAPMLFK